MAAVTEVTAIYRADTAAFVRGTKQAQSAAQQFANAMGQADLASARTKASTIALGSAVGLVATQALTQATAKVKEFAKQGINAARDYEQTVISIEGIFVGMGMTIGQATAETKTYLADLRDFAATTPFELPQTLDAVKRLLSIGYAAEDVKDRLLPAIGDITSALGQPASSINAVVYAMGQIKSAGRVMAQDLMQIGNALPGFNARMAIAKELFNGDMAAMAEAVESGALTGEKAIEALISQMQKFPGAAGAMERQSKTLSGVISTFKDTVNNALIDALMPAMPVLSDALTNLVDPVSQLAVAFASQLGPILIQVAQSATEFAPQFSELAAAIMDLAGGAVIRLVQVMGELAPLISAAAKVVGTLADVLMNLPGPVLAAMAALLIMMKTSLGMAFIKAVGAAGISVARFATTTTTSAATASTGFSAIGASAVASMRVTDAAMKAGTAAVNGFKVALSSTGIGLLIVGISTALTAMAMSSDEAATAGDNLADSILDQNNALTENHRLLAAKTLADLGVLDAASKAGIATNELVDAYLQGGAALAPYVQRMKDYASANGQVAGTLAVVAGAMGQWEFALGENAGSVMEGAEALETLGGSLDTTRAKNDAARIAAEGATAVYVNNAAETGRMGMATIRAAQAAGMYTPSAQTAAAATSDLAAEAAAAEAALAAMRAENEKWLAVTGQISAVDAAATALENIGTAAGEYGTKLMAQTPKARQFRGEVINAFEASARAASELGTTVEEQRTIFTGELVKIVAALRASGVKDRDIQQFIGAMDDLPASVEEIMTAAGMAVGKGAKRFQTDVQKQIEKAFSGGAKASRPLNEQAMDAMAQAATDKAKSKLGLTLEPELASVLKASSSALTGTAKAAGDPVGLNLSSGIAAGIDRGSPLVKDAVERVIAAAKAAADAASQSQSPSRLFMQVGDNLIQGLRIGWVKGNKAFTNEIARTVQDAWWSMKDAQDAVADAKKALEDVRAEQAKGEASARDVAAAERALARAYRDSADAAREYAEAQRTIKAFRKLATMPLSPDAIRQFIGFDETGMDSLQIAETIVQNMEKGFEQARRVLIRRAMRAGMSREAAEAYADSVMETFGREIETKQRLLGEAMERLAKVREQILDLEAKQEERTAAGKTIAKFITDRFGEPSEFKKAYDATSVSIDQAMSLFDQYEQLIRQRFTGLNEADADVLIKQFEENTKRLIGLIRERDAINVRLQEAQKRLTDLQAQRADAEKKLADSIRGFFKPSGKIGSADEFIMGLQQRVDATRKYMADIDTLRRRGVAQQTIDQILEMGVDSGGSLAAALASASNAQLQQVNMLTTTAEGLAQTFGDTQASIMYDAGIKSQQALVAGIQTELTNKQKEIQAVVDQIGAMFAGLTDSNLVAGEAAAQALLAGLKDQEDEILAYIRNLATQIRNMLLEAMQPPSAPAPAPGKGGGGGGGRGRSAMVPTAPAIPYSTAPAITVASGGVQVAVTVGADQNPAAASETVKMAVMEALSEVAARAANARR